MHRPKLSALILMKRAENLERERLEQNITSTLGETFLRIPGPQTTIGPHYFRSPT